MPAYDASPVRWDHELVIGDDYAPGVVGLFTEDEAGTEDPYDLTGATGEVQLRSEPNGALALSPTWELVGDGSLGTFQWTDTDTNTAALTPGRYRYAVRVTFSDGTKRTVLWGYVEARKTVLP